MLGHSVGHCVEKPTQGRAARRPEEALLSKRTFRCIQAGRRPVIYGFPFYSMFVRVRAFLPWFSPLLLRLSSGAFEGGCADPVVVTNVHTLHYLPVVQ